LTASCVSCLVGFLSVKSARLRGQRYLFYACCSRFAGPLYPEFLFDPPILTTCRPNGLTQQGLNNPVTVGDNPNLPRDPDKFDGTVDAQREFRQRGIPSGLANEVFIDVYERLASFEPAEPNLQNRLFDAYAAEVARVDPSHHGIITAPVGDIDTPTDGFANNERLYLPPTVFNRFAVTREINDGLLAPRFSPSQRAWVLAGGRVAVTPAVAASTGRDADDR